MTILELENLTGLDRATIRYYEKEGLISPARMENSYRDYSDVDLQEILRIKLLRQLELPIYQIKELQQGSRDMNSVLKQHSVFLEQQIKTTERAAKICQEILDAAVSYNSLDAAEYLEKMKTPETCDESTEKPKPLQPTSREYHPVRRLAARLIDYALVKIPIRFLLIVILRIRPFDDWISNLIGYATPFLCVPLMALSLSKFGTTPGKWMMGIRVEARSGRYLSFHDALIREWNALRYGYGFGIPFWQEWKMYKSYREYSNYHYLERDLGVDYNYTYWYVRKKSVFAIICAISIVLTCINGFEVIKPRYRGNHLTVAEFAENYNFYATVLEYGYTMEADGTWPDSTQNQTGNSVDQNSNTLIVFGNKVEKHNEPFRFETEGEYIKRITYENAWTEIIMLQPLSQKMLTAIVTTVCSQKGVGINKLQDFLKMMQKYEGDTSVNIQYENIEINWTINATNCINAGGKFYTDDDKKPSRVSFFLEIIIHDSE